MLRTAQILFLCLVATPLLAQDAFEDGPSGLVIKVPEGWARDPRSEKGPVRFAATYDIAKRKYVLFRVEAGPAAGFDANAWLTAESKSVEGAFKAVTTPFKRENGKRVGGLEAAAFEVAGRVEPDGGEPYPLRIRGCGVVKGDIFFKFTEASFNDAHAECADALAAMWDAISFQEASGALPADGAGGGGNAHAVVMDTASSGLASRSRRTAAAPRTPPLLPASPSPRRTRGATTR